MATWIVHLRLAENLLSMIDGLDPTEFAIGNIAPDSGIPDEKWEKFDPPGYILHFQNPNSNSWRSADLEFYRQHMNDLKWQNDGDKRFSFLLGYFFHLLTDSLWDHEIGNPTQVKYAAEFEDDPDFVWEVKRDWYGLDFIYVRNHPESIFQRLFLDCEYEKDYLDFLPVEGVQQRIAYIKEFYQREDEKVQALLERPYVYLSQGKMDSFVEETTQRLYQIFEYLWIQKKKIPDSQTMLDVPFG
ncbi:MAG: zinc dependent phospholipase C family protein [Candidatus Hodarchaeota archaeon]